MRGAHHHRAGAHPADYDGQEHLTLHRQNRKRSAPPAPQHKPAASAPLAAIIAQLLSAFAGLFARRCRNHSTERAADTSKTVQNHTAGHARSASRSNTIAVIAELTTLTATTIGI